MRTSRNKYVQEYEVLGAMLAGPLAWHLGLVVTAAAGVPLGAGYPILARVEREGWVESRWDDGPPGAPRRRLYRLTGLGERIALEADPGPLPCVHRRPLRFPTPQGQLG